MAKRGREDENINELCKGVKRLHPTTSTSLSGGFPENLKVSDSVGTIKHVYAPINHRMADGSVSGAPRSSDKDQEHQMQSDKSLYSDFNAFLFQLHTERMARQSQSKAEPNIDESGL